MSPYNIIDNNIIEDNVVEDVVNPEMPKVVDNEFLTIYVPLAGYNTPGLAKFSKNHFKVLSDGMVIPDFRRTTFKNTSDSESIRITLENNMVYYVSGYKEVIIDAPVDECTSHVFVSFEGVDSPIGFKLPEGIKVYGRFTRVLKGDFWEFSIDTVGGIVFSVYRGE